MAYLSLYTHGADHASYIVDLSGKSVGICIAAVEVFAADSDGNDPVTTVGIDGVDQGLLLCVVVVRVFGPESDEDSNTRCKGCWDGVGESVAVTSCIETDGSEVARKSGELLKLTLPLCLSLAGTVRILGGEVETFPVGGCEWKESRYGGNCAEEFHVG